MESMNEAGGSRGFKHCPMCAAPLTKRVVGLLPRLACNECGFIFYQNPVAAVAVVLTRQDEVLLILRDSSFRRGQWCFPSGYVEWNEDVRSAAVREVREEVGLDVDIREILAVHSNFPEVGSHSVGIYFAGSVIGGCLTPGDDAADAKYFSFEGLPPNLAFESDRKVLEMLRTPKV